MTSSDAALEDARAAELRRCRAIETGDKETVAAFFHPELIYIHSNGIIHDRATTVALYLKTDVRFLRCERRNLRAWRVGDVVLMSGEIITVHQLGSSDPPVESISFLTQTYVRDDSGWRLAQVHATKDARDERGAR